MFASHLSTVHKSAEPLADSGPLHATCTCLSTSTSHFLITSKCWIVDSGASKNICSNLSDFMAIRSIQDYVVTLPNHTQIVVKFCGDVKLNSRLILKDDLFVPEFKFNLFSVSSFITSSQLAISFFNGHFIIQDHHLKTTIGKGIRVENLYVLDDNQPYAEFLTNHISVSTWHNLLGRPSFKVMESLKNQIKCDVFSSSRLEPCSICPLAKQKRLPFVSNSHMSQFSFDLVHCDIWGPYNAFTIHDEGFFLTLVDDCTRFTWVFLLKNKSDASSIISWFYAMVETQFQRKMKAFGLIMQRNWHSKSFSIKRVFYINFLVCKGRNKTQL